MLLIGKYISITWYEPIPDQIKYLNTRHIVSGINLNAV